jgi:hypothetical protein
MAPIGFVKNPIQTRHKLGFQKWDSSQNLFWGMGFVTKPILGNGVRHKTYFGEWNSSQNLFWGMGFVTKSLLGIRPTNFVLEIGSGKKPSLANGTRGSNWEPVPFLDLGFVSSVLP